MKQGVVFHVKHNTLFCFLELLGTIDWTGILRYSFIIGISLENGDES